MPKGIRTRFPSRDLTGETFGRWKVLGLGEPDQFSHTRWRCQCKCGAKKDIYTGSLVRGLSKSCGCLKSEIVKKRLTTHGRRTSPEYGVWQKMIARCENPHVERYPYYGGRGIKVCERWRKDFAMFFTDMGLRPSVEHQIDRIDNDGGYEPGNCRWATDEQQRRNRSDNHLIEYNGETMCLTDWARRLGMRFETLYKRLEHGWSVERALSEPVHIEKSPRKRPCFSTK